MTTQEPTEAQLLAYAYGELSGPEARAFEQRLQGDPALQAELASIMATRDLMGRDAHFGIDSKVDVPPPHLLDAIVRAEVLARPPEIRNARALEPRPSLTARLSRWLVGGGVVVGAAAAVLVMVTQTQGNVMAPMPKAEAPASPVAVDEPPAQEAAVAPAGLASADDGARDPSARLAPAPESPEPLRDAPAAMPRADAALPKPAEPPADVAGGERLKLTETDGAGLAVGAAAGGSGRAGALGAKGDEALAKDARDEDRREPPAKSQLEGASSRGAEERERANQAFAGDDLGFDAAPSPPPPPASVATTSAAPAAPSAAPTAPRRAPAPDAPPSEAPALKERPTTTLDLLTREEAKAERRRLAESLRGQSAKAKKPSSKNETQSVPSDKTDSKKRAEKAPVAQAGPEAKRAMQSEMALMSGYRELKEGRPLDALDEFQSAERLDARRALGSDPHVGQMRALVALKRPAEALAIARRLAARDVAEGGVVDGLLLGAKTAEAVGDLRTARELWTALLKVPAQKSAASAALARIGNPAVRSMDVDAAEAAAEPAAAAPASEK